MIYKKNNSNTDEIDIIIPVGLDDEMDIKNSIKSIIDLHEKNGFNKFMLAGPSKGWRSIAYPPKDCFDQIANKIIEYKKNLQNYNIQVGWWHTLTLKTGKSQYQRIVNIDGQISEISSCPLDLKFQERFAQDVALVAEKAKPFMIIFEDDFGINCHNGYACFCDLHLQEFARQTGKYYSREELQEKLMAKTNEATALRLKWGELSRDCLVTFARHVRKTVDKLNPLIPMGSMQPGCADFDGNSTAAVAKAFAGKHHKAFVRLHGTSYSDDDISDVPQNIFHALYSRQHLPENFTFYHESDTYPHTRFFMSAGKMRSLMATAYSYAFDGSTFQARQHLDAANEEKAYCEMFKHEQKRFNTIRNIAKKCIISGCGLIFDPLGFCRNADNDNWFNNWVRAFAHFGIPYTTKETQVNVLSGTVSNTLSDEEIKMLLKKGLLLDGEAAKLLCDRGFSEDIGVMVKSKYKHNIIKDIESKERICSDFSSANAGRLMNGCFNYSPHGKGELFRIEPLNSNCEIITDLLNFQFKKYGIGMTRYENKQGGRVAVMAMTVKNNMSSSLLNYRRQRLIQNLVVWLGANDIVCVKERAKIFCILNRPLEKFKNDFSGVVTLINLCSDNFESVELYIPEKWRNNCTVKYLDYNGVWKELNYKYTDEGIEIFHPLRICEPLYLCFYDN